MSPHDQLFVAQTEHLSIRPVRLSDAGQLLDFYCYNRLYFEEWEPQRGEDFFTLAGMQAMLAEDEQAFAEKSAVRFGLFDRHSQSLVGTCHFSQIVMGAFQACYLGFLLDERHKGQGLMFEGAGCCIDMMFRFGLHRIMGNYCPENVRTGKLLARLGFVQEGMATEYLYLNGRWRDHVLTSKIYHPL